MTLACIFVFFESSSNFSLFVYLLIIHLLADRDQ